MSCSNERSRAIGCVRNIIQLLDKVILLSSNGYGVIIVDDLGNKEIPKLHEVVLSSGQSNSNYQFKDRLRQQHIENNRKAQHRNYNKFLNHYS